MKNRQTVRANDIKPSSTGINDHPEYIRTIVTNPVPKITLAGYQEEKKRVDVQRAPQHRINKEFDETLGAVSAHIFDHSKAPKDLKLRTNPPKINDT